MWFPCSASTKLEWTLADRQNRTVLPDFGSWLFRLFQARQTIINPHYWDREPIMSELGFLGVLGFNNLCRPWDGNNTVMFNCCSRKWLQSLPVWMTQVVIKGVGTTPQVGSWQPQSQIRGVSYLPKCVAELPIFQAHIPRIYIIHFLLPGAIHFALLSCSPSSLVLISFLLLHSVSTWNL